MFEAAACTTIEAAKELTAESPCLKDFPATQRAKFLQELEATDMYSGLRPFLPKQSIEHLREWPPDVSRALYMLVNDSTILHADPLGLLNKQLHEYYHNRLCDAKLLTRDSTCFKRVPTAAVDRFLELVAHHEIPSGQCCMAYSSTRAPADI
jgi:hypothetical protein